VPTDSPQTTTPDLSFDDMDDSLEIADLKKRLDEGDEFVEPLSDALDVCEKTVLRAFRRHDSAAVDYQWYYRWFARGSVAFGALAVILAIGQLAFSEEGVCSKISFSPLHCGLSLMEVIAIAVSVLLILVAIALRMRDTWLAERFKAESLRLIKFKSLTDPRMWNAGRRLELKRDLEREVEQIEARGSEAVEQWASEGTVPRAIDLPSSDVPRQTLAALVRYYHSKRLTRQLHYLIRRAERERKHELRTWILGPSMFFASVAFVLAHVVLAFGAKSVEKSVNRGLIFFAALLPALAATTRTFRAGRESGRNADRHEATRDSLLQLSRQLDDADLKTAFQAIGFCEQVLEADAREWMRLMRNAEWFG
jgi:hypothetical protein